MARISMTLELKNSVQGKAIIDAVKSCAGDGYVERKEYINDDALFTIGNQSSVQSGDVIIAVGGGFPETKIDPQATYNKIAVISHNWGGEKLGVLESEGAYVTFARKFRDKLRTILDR